jgi:transaldolase
MRFFLDTIDVDEAKRVRDLGLLDGILLRPEKAEAAGLDLRKLISDLAPLPDGPVVAPVAPGDAKTMYKEARELHKFGKNVVIRVPLTASAMKVVRLLGDDQIATDVHQISTPVQALLAARAGSAYLSVSVGALDDGGQVGMDVVEQIIRIYDTYGLQTLIAVEGVQSPVHVLDAAMMGTDVCTLPFSVLEKILKQIPEPEIEWVTPKNRPHHGPRRLH